MRRFHWVIGLGFLFFLLPLLVFVACDESQEAQRLQLWVYADPLEEAQFTTDLGYEVELQQVWLAVADIEFTTEGETHASLLEQGIVNEAMAHPGHYAGGTVIGELQGHFFIDLLAQAPSALGEATLLPGSYQGANFTFIAGEQGDEIQEDHPLFGVSFMVEGVAQKEGESYVFKAAIGQDSGRQVVGLPMSLELEGATELGLHFQLYPVDPVEGDTLLDGIDFAALDESERLPFSAESEAYNRLKKAIQVHDFYGFEVID